uniref:POLAc domain-containing protein n=1 Tax=Angiostrongylus cantonensis TaxID=6313 RepID=A0A158P9B1_ANGCA
MMTSVDDALGFGINESYETETSTFCSTSSEHLCNDWQRKKNHEKQYVLSVDCTHKSGTLKRGVTRSQSRSSSRGATPEQGSIRFSPRTVRKETGRHLNTEELNGLCGTINMTRHDLLSTHLSTMIEILDSRGQIVKLATSFSPEKFSPASSHSHSSPEVGEKQSKSSSPLDINKDNDRRQHIVEQLKRIGVFVDGNGRVVIDEQRPPSSERATNPDADTSKINSTLSGDTMMTSESGHTSFYSVNQVLETSGEGGYATAYDASPEGDVSLNLSSDRSAWESTPSRTHEITLSNFNISEVHHEDEIVSQNGAKTSTPKQKQDKDDHQDTTPVVGKHYRKLDLDVQSCEVANCVKETSDVWNKNEKFTSTELICSLADDNKSGYCSQPGSASNQLHKPEDVHFVAKFEGSFREDDVIKENSNGLSIKPCEHSESCREEMDSGQEQSTHIERATVRELCALFEGAIDRTKGHLKAFDVLLPEERVVLSVGHLKESENMQRMERDVDAKNCLKNDDLIDSVHVHDMSQSDFERKPCIEMDSIPNDVCVANEANGLLSGRHHSLPIFLEYTQMLDTERRENTPASEVSDEILTISAISPIESVTITVEDDKTSDTEKPRSSEEFSSMPVSSSIHANIEVHKTRSRHPHILAFCPIPVIDSIPSIPNHPSLRVPIFARFAFIFKQDTDVFNFPDD